MTMTGTMRHWRLLRAGTDSHMHDHRFLRRYSAAIRPVRRARSVYSVLVGRSGVSQHRVAQPALAGMRRRCVLDFAADVAKHAWGFGAHAGGPTPPVHRVRPGTTTRRQVRPRSTLTPATTPRCGTHACPPQSSGRSPTGRLPFGVAERAAARAPGGLRMALVGLTGCRIWPSSRHCVCSSTLIEDSGGDRDPGLRGVPWFGRCPDGAGPPVAWTDIECHCWDEQGSYDERVE